MLYSHWPPRNDPPQRSAVLLITLAAAGMLLLAALPAEAAVYWKVAAGDWSAAANWGGALPAYSDDAYIVNSERADITTSGAVV